MVKLLKFVELFYNRLQSGVTVYRRFVSGETFLQTN